MDEETSLQMDEEELKKLNEVIVEEVTVMEEVMEEVTGSEYDEGGDVRVPSMMMVVMVPMCSDDDGDVFR
ncbi:hypothetical protein Tco_0132721 [Tanacetum coccineum]